MGDSFLTQALDAALGDSFLTQGLDAALGDSFLTQGGLDAARGAGRQFFDAGA